MPSRVSKEITNAADLSEILSYNEDTITQDVIIELFGEFNGNQRFHPYDTITVPAGAYGPEGHKNKNSFKTTIGLWLFNRFMFERECVEVVGYVNYEITGGKWEDIIDNITQKVLEDDLPPTVLHHLLLKHQLLMPLCAILTPTFTEKFMNLSKVIEPKKDELFKKYEKEIAEGDVLIASKIEKELMQTAMDYLGDDPSLDLYLSGARSKLGNDFKNMYIMKGAIRNPDPNAEHQFTIAKSCYNNGISKEEYHLFANELAAGPYSRSRKTQIGGYWEKLFTSAYQHISLDEPGSDCKTKDYEEIFLDKKSASDWMYSYIIENNGNLVELNSKNVDKYIGKKVKFRFAAYCESKTGICNACAGNLIYKLGYRNVGLAMSNIASRIKNINMKAFHDNTVNLSTINPKDAFGC